MTVLQLSSGLQIGEGEVGPEPLQCQKQRISKEKYLGKYVCLHVQGMTQGRIVGYIICIKQYCQKVPAVH